MSRTVSENFEKHSRKESMLINTTRQEEIAIDGILAKIPNYDASKADVDTLITIIERLDAVITDKDAMIKRLQQGV
jgi:hypothetical protein